MFSHALVATDLSDASTRMLECAGQLRALGVERVTLFHAETAFHTVGLDESLARADRPELEAQAGLLKEQGYAVDLRVARGIPWHAIVEAAREGRADLVVLASHGHGALAETVLGTTAGQVVEFAPCPVLVLRLSLLDEDGGRYCSLRFRNVLDRVVVPVDFSSHTIKAVGVVQDLGPRVATAVLLHVNPPGLPEHGGAAPAEAFAEDDRGRLEGIAKTLRDAGCREVEIRIEAGDPRERIVAASEEATLLVLGSRGWTPWKELLLGSTAHAAVRHARCPVLLVR
ncbi:universal stress protein [Deferrisoma palaeochoriense]